MSDNNEKPSPNVIYRFNFNFYTYNYYTPIEYILQLNKLVHKYDEFLMHINCILTLPRGTCRYLR